MGFRRAVLIVLGFVFVAGCSAGPGGGNAELIHLVEQESIRSIHPDGVYESGAFDESENIHASALARNEGHSVSLAQIKDREQLHVHDEHDLIVHLLSGRGELRTRGQSLDVKPGDWTVIPRGKAHQFVTTSEVPARVLVVRTPPVNDDRRPVTRSTK